MEDTCTNRAALSRGILKPQQVLLSSPHPSELGDGALGSGGRLALLRISLHWLGVLKDSDILSQRTDGGDMKHRSKAPQDQQKEAQFFPLLLHPVPHQAPRALIKGSSYWF